MGAITVRYLQYLLKKGFFDEIEGRTKINKARVVASLTSLSGANNGSLIVNHCGMEYDRKQDRWALKKGGKMIWAFK
jgi:triacylglycerol esterase/lipase EstA (alpha/beta hydrolase family)